MTKEDVKRIINDCVRNGCAAIAEKCIDDLYEENICIPKGENRHPYADVLHEWIESRVGVLQLRYSGAKDWDNDEDLSFALMEYRIKPSDPIYEWQWKYKIPDSKSMWDGYTMHATEDEFKVFKQDWMAYEKDESTKRERK